MSWFPGYATQVNMRLASMVLCRARLDVVSRILIMRMTGCVCVMVGLLLIPMSKGFAWHDEGHVYTVHAAVEALPDSVPAFFRGAGEAMAHGSIDPDGFKHRKLPQLDAAEYPEHFFDLELLEGREVPASRYEFLAMCRDLGVEPQKVGMLPYAIAEWHQRLVWSFAEHRARPENEHVKRKAIVYAGLLAHYAADLEMPLHCSIHWDGRANADLSSPRTGIHMRVDALPTKIPFGRMFDEPLEAPAAIDGEPFALIVRKIKASNGRVDAVYAMEAEIPAMDEMKVESETVRAFTRDRMRAAARLIGTLYFDAWERSADVELHDWLDRDTFDDGFDRSEVPVQPDR